MKTEHPLLTFSVTANGALTKHRFVNFSNQLAVASDEVIGVCAADTDSGEEAPVVSHGIVLVEASGAVAAGKTGGVDNNGKLLAHGGAGPLIHVLDAATAAGDFVRVILPAL